MQKLHLVGFTTELDGLIFSTRRGAKSGSFVVSLDGELLGRIAEAGRLKGGHAAAEEGAGVAPPGQLLELVALAQRQRLATRPASTLSPREMQDRLRAGRSIDEVAQEAGVDRAWVARFAAPVLAEQDRVATLARSLTFHKPRVGVSALPLGAAVRRRVAERGVHLADDEIDRAWTAFQVDDSLWVIDFSYTSRGRLQRAEWSLNLETVQLLARNRLAGQLGHVAGPPPEKGPPGRRTSSTPSPRSGAGVRPGSTVSAPRAGTSGRPSPGPAAVPTAKRAPSKKAPSKSAPAKRAPSKKAPSKRAPSEKALAKRAPSEKALAKRAPSKKAPSKKAPSKRAPSKKAPSKKAPSKKAPSKRAPSKRAPSKRAPSKRAPSKRAPSEKAPSKRAPSKKAPAPAKRTPAKKAPSKSAPAKGAPAKRTPNKAAPSKKTPSKRTPNKAAPVKKAATPASAQAGAARRPPVSAAERPRATRSRPGDRARRRSSAPILETPAPEPRPGPRAGRARRPSSVESGPSPPLSSARRIERPTLAPPLEGPATLVAEPPVEAPPNVEPGAEPLLAEVDDVGRAALEGEDGVGEARRWRRRRVPGPGETGPPEPPLAGREASFRTGVATRAGDGAVPAFEAGTTG